MERECPGEIVTPPGKGLSRNGEYQIDTHVLKSCLASRVHAMDRLGGIVDSTQEPELVFVK